MLALDGYAQKSGETGEEVSVSLVETSGVRTVDFKNSKKMLFRVRPVRSVR